MWSHGGHVGVPKQRNGGHIGAPRQSSGSQTLFFMQKSTFLSVNQCGCLSSAWKRSTGLTLCKSSQVTDQQICNSIQRCYLCFIQHGHTVVNSQIVGLLLANFANSFSVWKILPLINYFSWRSFCFSPRNHQKSDCTRRKVLCQRRKISLFGNTNKMVAVTSSKEALY